MRSAEPATLRLLRTAISRLARIWIPAVLCAAAQQTPPAPPQRPALVYQGKPIAVPYECNEEELQSTGMSCTDDEPCAIFLELSGIDSTGAKIFVAGNFHSASATLSSIALQSEDGGKTWRELLPSMRATGLEQVQFFDLERGWISGQVLYPLARDPFFLISDDGGKTWRQRNVFGESRVGAVQQFWFTSRDAGRLLIDRSQSGEGGSRYELHESMNGGESWAIREAGNQPLPLGRAAQTGGNPDWRIRADGPSKSFRVEKRSGEKWTAVAAFLVPVATCKSVVRPEAKPPEEANPSEPGAEPFVKELQLPGSTPVKKKPPK